MCPSENGLLKKIPKLDELLAHPALAGRGGPSLLKDAARQVLTEVREDILRGQGMESEATAQLLDADALAARVLSCLAAMQKPGLHRVINGTGIVLHTNLGRAPLAREALEAITEAARGYSNLEYDTAQGKRGSRHAHVENLLTRLTGAEAAMVVNNNAAAVLLALAVLAGGCDVVTSRGELVEIGGSFRIPDVCVQSGCRLVEVGTTNRTHLRDYARALLTLSAAGEKCGSAILRVHASNFVMSGFVVRPSLEELATLSREHGVPLIEDLGSGALLEICGSPTAADSIRGGADIVTFSGDKLLGGAQAGIIAGRAELIAKMKAHPLARALRIDKLSLAALEATLRLYLDPAQAREKIPVLQMLSATQQQLHEKAERLAAVCAGMATVRTRFLISHAGGGVMPEEALPSAGVAVTHPHFSAGEIELFFRKGEPPIVGRVSHDEFLLDVRTVGEADFPLISQRLAELEASCAR